MDKTRQQQFIEHLEKLLGPANVLASPGDCLSYGYDNSRQDVTPDAVAFVHTHEEVVGTLALCNEFKMPIVARGRGTGTVGGAVPTHKGLVLSFERMNKILQISPENRYIVVQPGVTNEEVQLAAKAHGFFWAPDPSSGAFCSVGGNLAYNSAGPRAVKYGTTRENTLGLKAVTGAGETLKTGTRTTKGVVGYDLTRLIIGSEGTLAVITEATLKLLPLATCKKTMQATYNSFAAATAAVAAIMAQPVIPCALEFMDKHSLDAIRRSMSVAISNDAEAFLMIEVDGEEQAVSAAATAIQRAATNAGLIEYKLAQSAEEVQNLWAMRKALSPALRQIAPKKINEDVVVPVANMPQLIEGVHRLAEHYRVANANFGHAGNGNIHVNLLVDHHNAEEMARAEQCLDEIFSLVLKLDGTLSGEHGVGLMKQPFIARELDKTHLALMAKIKAQFDPNNILNPGKIIPQ